MYRYVHTRAHDASRNRLQHRGAHFYSTTCIITYYSVTERKVRFDSVDGSGSV